jgi:hypothetical protein
MECLQFCRRQQILLKNVDCIKIVSTNLSDVEINLSSSCFQRDFNITQICRNNFYAVNIFCIRQNLCFPSRCIRNTGGTLIIWGIESIQDISLSPSHRHSQDLLIILYIKSSQIRLLCTSVTLSYQWCQEVILRTLIYYGTFPSY